VRDEREAMDAEEARVVRKRMPRRIRVLEQLRDRHEADLAVFAFESCVVDDSFAAIVR